jgi:hypothetical protein
MRTPLDPRTADRLLSRALGPDDVPPGLEEVARTVSALRAPMRGAVVPGEHSTVAAMAHAIEGAVPLHDVKFVGTRTDAMEPQDVKLHDVKATTVHDVKRAPAPRDAWEAPPPPAPIRMPLPAPGLDRTAWAGQDPRSAWRRILQPVLSKSWGERRRPLKARVAALATAAMLLSTGGAAAAGALPGPLQTVASRVLHAVGIHVPSGGDGDGSSQDGSVPATAPTTEPTAPAPSQHGTDVSRAAHDSDARGREHGRDVSGVARNGHGKGPGPGLGPNGGASQHHRQDGAHAKRDARRSENHDQHEAPSGDADHQRSVPPTTSPGHGGGSSSSHRSS